MRSFTVVCVCLAFAIICSSATAKKASKKSHKVKSFAENDGEGDGKDDGPPKTPDPTKVQEIQAGSGEEEQESGPELNKEDIERLKQAIKTKLMQNVPAKKSRKRVEMDANQKKAYDTMKQIMVRVLLISKVAMAGAPIGHLLGIFIALVDTSVAQEGNIWNQVKDKVDAKISGALTRYHFDKSGGHFTKFQTMAKIKQNKYSIDDLVDIIAAKHDMLPYNFRDIGYSEEMATLLPTWTIFMTTAYLQLIANEKVDRCSLSAELVTLRKETIKTAKSLFRKRYKKIDGTATEKKRPDGCVGMVCFFAYHLTYTDRFNEEERQEIISKAEYVFSDVQREVVDSLMRILIEPINEFFKPEICQEGCECPQPITKNDINFEYPKSCYGKATGDNPGQCTLPCDKYDYGYLWCPYYPHKSAYSYGDNNNKIGSRWDYCTEADWDTCMPV